MSQIHIPRSAAPPPKARVESARRREDSQIQQIIDALEGIEAALTVLAAMRVDQLEQSRPNQRGIAVGEGCESLGLPRPAAARRRRRG